MGVKVVREVFGVMTARHAQGAIIVTSGIFTQDAKTFAAGKPIEQFWGCAQFPRCRGTAPIR